MNDALHVLAIDRVPPPHAGGAPPRACACRRSIEAAGPHGLNPGRPVTMPSHPVTGPAGQHLVSGIAQSILQAARSQRSVPW
jgi:hypothetical protein